MSTIIDITQSNFNELYPTVCQSIDTCSFYGIDCEFSGLNADNLSIPVTYSSIDFYCPDYYEFLRKAMHKCSLFDSPKERYQKAKENIKDYVIVQFGLTTFTHVRGGNAFDTATYNFYLMPFAHETFQYKLGNIEFLSAHGFNWQKLLTDGLQYISWADEKYLSTQLESDALWFDILKDLSFHYNDCLKEILTKVNSWYKAGAVGELVLYISPINPYFSYLIYRIIPQRHRYLIVSRIDRSHIKVTKTAQESQTGTIQSPTSIIEEYFLGFSKVWKVLLASKKPMIGHNLFMDLAMMFQQFVGPLPGNYGSFKLALHNIFPVIFDTKHISFDLRKLVPREKEWPTNSLGELFNFFRTDPFLSQIMMMPAVKPVPEGNYHNAGYDAFCSGFCFIRFCYLLSIWSKQSGKFIYPLMPKTYTELLSAMSEYVNNVNMIRCQVNSICLDGKDPTGRRPDILLVESKTHADFMKHVKRRYSRSWIIRLLYLIYYLKDVLNCYSCVDLKILSRNRVLLAIGSFAAARQIQQSLKNNSIRIIRYNPLLHNRTLLLSGAVSIGLIATLYVFLRLR